jgi:hypothetical protein
MARNRRYVAQDAIDKLAECPCCGFVDTPDKRAAWLESFRDDLALVERAVAAWRECSVRPEHLRPRKAAR